MSNFTLEALERDLRSRLYHATAAGATHAAEWWESDCRTFNEQKGEEARELIAYLQEVMIAPESGDYNAEEMDDIRIRVLDVNEAIGVKMTEMRFGPCPPTILEGFIQKHRWDAEYNWVQEFGVQLEAAREAEWGASLQIPEPIEDIVAMEVTAPEIIDLTGDDEDRYDGYESDQTVATELFVSELY